MVKITSKINKDIVTINKSEVSQSKSSLFSIVINPNKSYAYDYEGKMGLVKYWFYKCCEYLFAKKNIVKLLMCVCKECKAGNMCSQADFHDKIDSIDCTSSVEVGSRSKFLHANITLNVVHYTRVHVDAARIRKIANLIMSKAIDNPNVYVGIKCSSANLHKLTNYVTHANEYKEI